VAFVIKLRPAIAPSLERAIGPTSKVSPPAVKGMRSAKIKNGNSIVARLASVQIGRREKKITVNTIKKYPIKLSH